MCKSRHLVSCDNTKRDTHTKTKPITTLLPLMLVVTSNVRRGCFDFHLGGVVGGTRPAWTPPPSPSALIHLIITFP